MVNFVYFSVWRGLTIENLPGTGNHLCRCRGYPEYPERKRPGTQDKPEVPQPAV